MKQTRLPIFPKLLIEIIQGHALTVLMYEDELPSDISKEVYDRWFDNSFVDIVRIGPILR